uniref:Secreted protein n=1 Tax=Aegilops tauschii subsp. strangulata TaxID=200361 RepID=A0A453N221_AEGTS
MKAQRVALVSWYLEALFALCLHNETSRPSVDIACCFCLWVHLLDAFRLITLHHVSAVEISTLNFCTCP